MEQEENMQKNQYGSTARRTTFWGSEKIPFLYNKTDKYFKDKVKKQLAWEDVAKEAN